MGLLSEGEVLSWEETKALADHVRDHGIKQFINLYNKNKDRRNEPMLWGDEMEYMLVRFDRDKKRVQQYLQAECALKKLQAREEGDYPVTWHPEYGSYMIEALPRKPYGETLDHMMDVENNMKFRRVEMRKVLPAGVMPLGMSSFPRAGFPNYTYPEYNPTPDSGISRSIFCPDEAICTSHPRFRTLTRNIRERRGKKVVVNIPGDDGQARASAKENHIYMDCRLFGNGCSSLHVTIQASDIEEAKHIYDQLIPLTPVMSKIIGKPRYSTCSSYLSSCNQCFNDIDLPLDKNIYQQLRQEGIEDSLCRHIAHLFIRDPIVVYREKIHQNDEEESDHFENIQSTNWQTMRFKPPPPNTDIGWRVEFRPVEIQLTDFENAAYAIFVLLVTKVTLEFKLDFIIPMSLVDENMEKSYKRGAVLQEKFYFKQHILNDSECFEDNRRTTDTNKRKNDYILMTIDNILNGNDSFPGLIPLVYKYINSAKAEEQTKDKLYDYLNLISKRASGEVPTIESWMRSIVLEHPEYKQDSIVTDIINYDLLEACAEVSTCDYTETTYIRRKPEQSSTTD